MKTTAVLIDILNEEVKLYRQLLELARAKGRCIVSKQMEGVNEAQLAEQKLVEEVAGLEQKRQHLVRTICGEYGIAVQNGYVSELVKHTGSDGEKIRELAAVLRGIIEEMQGINDQNMKLIQQNIELIEGALKNVKVRSESKSSYNKDGNRKSVSVLFDKKG